MRKFNINQDGDLEFEEMPVLSIISEKQQQVSPMRRDFEKIKTVIESCTEISHISWCEQLLMNYKVMHQQGNEDGSIIILTDMIRGKEYELTEIFTL